MKDWEGLRPTATWVFFLHSALVVNAETREIVGLGAQELWARQAKKLPRVKRENCRKRVTESEVWGRVMDRVQPTSKDTRLIHVCDRGADNFDVFAHLHAKGDSWIIRGAQLRRKVLDVQGNVRKIDELLTSLPVRGNYEIIFKTTRSRKRWRALKYEQRQ